MRLWQQGMCVFSSLLVFAVAEVPAQEGYPSKVIRIVTAAPGSNNDWGARLVADGLSASLGQRAIVDNRGGLATEVVWRSPPDGYTILFYGSAAWTQQLFRDIPFDPLRDLAPISLGMSSPIVLVVHPSLPVKSVKELIALARARPGQLNYASGTIGATPYIAGEMLKYLAGLNIVRVAYKGTGPSMLGLLGGEVELMFPGAGSVWPHVTQRRLRALGVASSKPSALTPGLEPIGHTVPGYEVTSNIAFFAPAKTPQAIIDRLHQEITRALVTPHAKDLMFKAGVEPVASTPKALGDYVRMDLERVTRMLTATNQNFKSAR